MQLEQTISRSILPKAAVVLAFSFITLPKEVWAGYCENMKAIAYLSATMRDSGTPQSQLIKEFRKKNGSRNKDVEDLVAAVYIAHDASPHEFSEFFYSFCKSRE